ncbi:hypothetical protein R2APBS1_0261 [Rhodanobacter denitrificans]|uniref:Uncharacterized protein n=1 Tax=Rhodanobacter denitrificans TaxID=666685 RepID=M4NCE2_9GAMM|nr:hypothetical protein R2APBS1_0261 [Rhodanobacter denitrificans]
MGPTGQGEAIEAGRLGICAGGVFVPAPRWRIVPPGARLRRRGRTA